MGARGEMGVFFEEGGWNVGWERTMELGGAEFFCFVVRYEIKGVKGGYI